MITEPAALGRKLFPPSLVFVIVIVVHGLSGNSTSYDSRWSVHTSISIIKEGNSDLDEYREEVLRGDRYLYDIVGNHVYSSFPIGTPLLATPVVLAAHVVVSTLQRASANNGARQPEDTVSASEVLITHHRRLEVVAASLFVALAAVLTYLTGRLALNRMMSGLLAMVFAFCTSAWSTASRALWQHGPSMLMLAMTLYLLVVAEKRRHWAQFAGLPVAFAYVVRPTNALMIVLFSAFVAFRHRRWLLAYVGWLVLVLAPFVLYNLSIYHAPLAPYYSLGRVGSGAHFVEALAGNLISPARGLFVYSPVLLLSVWGMRLRLGGSDRSALDVVLTAAIAGHWLVVSSFPHWFAGHSYGPRFMSDQIPCFVYFLIPVMRRLGDARAPHRKALLVVASTLAATSLLVHLNGAVNSQTLEWNSNPVNVDRQPSRVWDWHDPQFLRGITRR